MGKKIYLFIIIIGVTTFLLIVFTIFGYRAFLPEKTIVSPVVFKELEKQPTPL